MARIVLDTSVVIGLIRSDDAHHRSAVAAIGAARGRGDTFILPATVLSECLVHPYRHDRAMADQVRTQVLELLGPVRALDEDVALASARLRRARPALRPEDSWVVATGVVDDAVVLTCDRRLAAVDPRVQVLLADP